jgi:uncharacterized protein YlxP (DUF503 family)
MTVGVLRLELAVTDARSLKDKRRVVKSIKDRLANRFKVSVAEVDALDAHQRAVIGVAVVSNDPVHAHRCLDRIVDFVRANRAAGLVDYEKWTC